MNACASKVGPNRCLLSVLLVFCGASAQAQNGMLEIRGVLTSPVCTIGTTNAMQLRQLTRINGQACGLTSSSSNPMSQMIIAHIREDTLSLGTGSTATTKQLVTLSYQ